MPIFASLQSPVFTSAVALYEEDELDEDDEDEPWTVLSCGADSKSPILSTPEIGPPFQLAVPPIASGGPKPAPNALETPPLEFLLRSTASAAYHELVKDS